MTHSSVKHSCPWKTSSGWSLLTNKSLVTQLTLYGSLIGGASVVFNVVTHLVRWWKLMIHCVSQQFQSQPCYHGNREKVIIQAFILTIEQNLNKDRIRWTKRQKAVPTHSLWILWLDWRVSLLMLLQASFLLSSVRSSKEESSLGDTEWNTYTRIDTCTHTQLE